MTWLSLALMLATPPSASASDLPSPLLLAEETSVCGLRLPAGTLVSVGDLTRGVGRVAVLGDALSIHGVHLPPGTRVAYRMSHMEEFGPGEEPPTSYQETTIEWVLLASPTSLPDQRVILPTGVRIPFENLAHSLVYMGAIETMSGDRCWWTEEEARASQKAITPSPTPTQES